MISKEQFLELKHLKSLGVPTTTICKKIGIGQIVLPSFLPLRTSILSPCSQLEPEPAWSSCLQTRRHCRSSLIGCCSPRGNSPNERIPRGIQAACGLWRFSKGDAFAGTFYAGLTVFRPFRALKIPGPAGIISP